MEQETAQRPDEALPCPMGLHPDGSSAPYALPTSFIDPCSPSAPHLPPHIPYSPLHPRHTHNHYVPYRSYTFLCTSFIQCPPLHPLHSPRCWENPWDVLPGELDSPFQGQIRHLLGGSWADGAAWGQGQGVSGLLRALPSAFSSDGVHVPLISPSPPNPRSHSASSLCLLRVCQFGEDTLITGLLEPFRFGSEELRCFLTE